MADSGDVSAFELETGETSVSISGSESADFLVNEKLDANVFGSGVVYYKGSPETNIQVSGSGRIKHV